MRALIARLLRRQQQTVTEELVGWIEKRGFVRMRAKKEKS